MTTFCRTYDKLRYDFSDKDCIGRECWAPGQFVHRGATSSGSRNTGSSTPCCVNRAYHGCPPKTAPSKLLVRNRRREGWRLA